jgi:hypothetical protein
LHNEELHNFYSPPSIIRVIREDDMGEGGMHRGFWYENLKERDHLEDLILYGRVMLKWLLKKKNERMCTGLVCLRVGTGGGLL